MKKLIPAIVMLLISALLLSTATFAWFSMNNKVTVTGMQVKATTGPSLVISGSTTFVAGTVEVSQSGTDITLMPTTAYTSGMLDATISHAALSAPATNLVYVANTGDVSPSTGLAKEGKTLYYAAATTAAVDGGAAGHYYDYTFYLAAEGSADIDAGSLVINVDAADFSTFDPAEYILQAVAVQPYVNGTAVGSPIYIKDGVSNQVMIANLATTSIPAGAPGVVSTAVAITLRVYLDGALLQSAGVTYVKNASIVDLTRAASFTAEFEVVTE